MSANEHSQTHIPLLTAAGVIATLSAVVLSLGIALFHTSQFSAERTGSEKNSAQAAASMAVLEQQKDPFADIVLEARAAYVWDMSRREALFAKNEEAQLPLASLSKLMTAFVAHEELPEDSVIVVGADALATEGDSGLYADEQWRFEDLLGLTLLASSNDGARALAVSASAAGDGTLQSFVAKMNETADAIGLAQTYFVNETGLDASERIGGGFGSAKDVAFLLDYIIRNAYDVIRATVYEKLTFRSLSGHEHTAENTNDIAHRIPGLVASKTGYTDLAGGNLVVAFDAGLNHPIVVAVLGSTREGRFRDSEKLIDAVFEKFAQ